MSYLGIVPEGVWISVVAGLFAGVIIGQATEYYTSDEYAPTKGIARQAQMGPATTIIDGIAVGFMSTAIPVLTVIAAILVAFWAQEASRKASLRLACTALIRRGWYAGNPWYYFGYRRLWPNC